jgi:RNA polymerase sigma-70 factor (ECF subfamily)
MQSGPEVAAAFDAGRSAWLAEISLSRERFAARVTAFACAEGDSSAIRVFETVHLAQVDLYLAHLRLTADALDEVRQAVRVKMLVGPPPAIARYRGRGSLGGWVRVISVRTALDLMAVGVEPSDVDLLDLSLSLDGGPELAAMRQLYRERMHAALERALRTLTPRDKTLLRLHVVDELSIDAIGNLYRVHRATVARWLVAIRGRIYANVKNELGLARAPSSSELRSLVGLLRDEIHISAKRILGA